MSWKDRLVLPLMGNSDIRLFSKSNIHLTIGYSILNGDQEILVILSYMNRRKL